MSARVNLSALMTATVEMCLRHARRGTAALLENSPLFFHKGTRSDGPPSTCVVSNNNASPPCYWELQKDDFLDAIQEMGCQCAWAHVTPLMDQSNARMVTLLPKCHLVDLTACTCPVWACFVLKGFWKNIFLSFLRNVQQCWLSTTCPSSSPLRHHRPRLLLCSLSTRLVRVIRQGTSISSVCTIPRCPSGQVVSLSSSTSAAHSANTLSNCPID